MEVKDTYLGLLKELGTDQNPSYHQGMAELFEVMMHKFMTTF